MNNKLYEFLNRPSTRLERNGFDRSFRSVFSCKAGQAIPACCIETVPRSYYEINPIDYLRTDGMNESNFVRMKQHLDFFFVPYSLIWRYWEQFYQQTTDPISAWQSAYGAEGDIGQPVTNLREPVYPLASLVLALCRASAQSRGDNYLTALDSLIENAYGDSKPAAYQYVSTMFLDSNESDGVKKDILGYPMYQGVVRLLDMLGYGNYLPFIKMDYTVVNSPAGDPDALTYKTNFVRWMQAYKNKSINIWRLAAYQAVCEFFYTNTHYVRPDVSRYNFDDVKTGVLPTSRGDYAVGLFSPHYVPWKFDLFTSALPSPQFGAVSLLASDVYSPGMSGNPTRGNNQVYSRGASESPSVVERSSGKLYVGTTTESYGDVKASIDIMSLKRAEALQAWKIAIGRAGYTSDARFEATFGSSPRFSPQLRPVRLGSIDADVLKDAVTGTSGEEFAQMASTGSSSLNGRKITFESEDFGVIIGIFRILPVAEYDSYNIDEVNTKFDPFDYFTPAFQNDGLKVLPAHTLSIFGSGLSGYDTALGYVPQGTEYKVGVDRVHGEFCQQPILFPTGGNDSSQAPVGEFQHFVSTRMDLETWQGDVKQFFVDPAVLDHIFVAGADETQSTDQFHVNLYCDIKAIQPMSVLGLPQFNN